MHLLGKLSDLVGDLVLLPRDRKPLLGEHVGFSVVVTYLMPVDAEQIAHSLVQSTLHMYSLVRVVDEDFGRQLGYWIW